MSEGVLTRAEIDRRLAARLSPAEVELLEPWIRPALRIRRGAPQDLPPGASRFAGPADVPPGFEWPLARESRRARAKRPLSLLAQINLAELPRPWLDELPPAGWLLFFLDTFDIVWGGHDEQPDRYRVYYVPPGQRLVRTRHPALPAADPKAPHATSFHPTWTMDDEGCRNDLSDESAQVARSTLSDVVLAQAGSHQLLGCPLAIAGRPGFKCEPYEAPESIADLERVNQINRPADRDRRWRLLLQVQHDDALNWRFGDCGLTYFMIRDSDLAAGRFEAAIPEMQCT
jgi:Domain of unknown function (DUF1963)